MLMRSDKIILHSLLITASSLDELDYHYFKILQHATQHEKS